MTVSEVFDSFILYKKASLLPKSVKDYFENIAPFVSFAGPDRDISLLAQGDVLKYQVFVNERDLSPASKGTRMRNVKIFLRWCIENGFLSSSSVDIQKIKLPKTYKKPISPFSNDQIVLLFESIRAENEWLTVRNKLLVALMLDSGLRQSEVCDLLSKNVFSDTMIVCGKGGKERTVPLGSVSRQFMASYRDLCPYSNDYLFVSRRGNKLSNNAVKLVFQKLKPHLPFDIYSHLLRHNFATNYCLDQMKEKGQVDVFSLQALMGHEDIKTTNVYLHFAMSIYASRAYNSHLDSVLLS